VRVFLVCLLRCLFFLPELFYDTSFCFIVYLSIIFGYFHAGVTNDFLIKTSSPLAIFYNDSSVLENYHCSVAFLLLQQEDSNIFS